MANTNKKTTQTKATEPKEKTFTKSEVDKMVESAVKAAMEKMSTANVAVKAEEYVTLMYIGAMAPGTTVTLGKRLGQINRPATPRAFPKKDFIESMGIPVVDALLHNRSLVVLDGLTEDERERFDVLYNADEILSAKMFYKLLDLEIKDLKDIYEKLCESHKRTVAKIFLEKYFSEKDDRITTEKVKMLNDISKEIDRNGLFTPILEDMGAKLAE